jgi:hypothetical protein
MAALGVPEGCPGTLSSSASWQSQPTKRLTCRRLRGATREPLIEQRLVERLEREPSLVKPAGQLDRRGDPALRHRRRERRRASLALAARGELTSDLPARKAAQRRAVLTWLNRRDPLSAPALERRERLVTELDHSGGNEGGAQVLGTPSAIESVERRVCDRDLAGGELAQRQRCAGLLKPLQHRQRIRRRFERAQVGLEPPDRRGHAMLA